jgi:DNA-directed RNA polymerase specialized sigma24 family protein
VNGQAATTPRDDVATHLFLARIAPALETKNPAALVESLLNQLPPDVRRVIVRVNGLDGQPLAGLKDVAREFKMSQGQVRALVAAGEQRLAEAIERLAAQQHENR